MSGLVSLPVRNYRELLLSLRRGRGRWCHTLKFCVKCFNVVRKALSGELSYMGIGLVNSVQFEKEKLYPR